MPLSHRPAEAQDIDACCRIVRGDLFYPPALRETRTAFWQQMLAEEAIHSVVIEDSEQPPQTRLRAFSFSAFITDTFAAEAKAGASPGLAASLHMQTLAGASPILGHAAISRANMRGGLTLVLNPFGYAVDDSEKAFLSVTEMMFDCLFTYHAGYQVKEVLIETHSWEWALLNLAAGLQTRTDYAAYFTAHPGDHPSPEQQPALLGLTREEAFASLGNRYFPLFVCAQPRFGFRRGEQRLLSQALRGGTNDDCARALGVSPSAVKKCWETVYARVTETAPELFSFSPHEAPPETKRGTGKKDRLLVYLHQHPEELRPYQR